MYKVGALKNSVKIMIFDFSWFFKNVLKRSRWWIIKERKFLCTRIEWCVGVQICMLQHQFQHYSVGGKCCLDCLEWSKCSLYYKLIITDCVHMCVASALHTHTPHNPHVFCSVTHLICDLIINNFIYI